MAATTEPPHTLENIAAYCGVTQQAIRQIEQRALRKLRKRLYCQNIKSFRDLAQL